MTYWIIGGAILALVPWCWAGYAVYLNIHIIDDEPKHPRPWSMTEEERQARPLHSFDDVALYFTLVLWPLIVLVWLLIKLAKAFLEYCIFRPFNSLFGNND